MFPFFIDFVLESELNATSADLSGVDKKKGNFVRSEGLFSDYVIDYWF